MNDNKNLLPPGTDIDARIAELSPEKRALLLKRLSRGSGDPGGRQLLRARSGERSFELSFAQQRLWFLEQWESGSALYNITRAWWLQGLLEVERLRGALAQLVARHESLRTALVSAQGQPRQQVLADLAVDLPLVDLRALPADQARAQALAQAQSLARQGFNLEQAPLLRLTLLRVTESTHLLVLVMHHIISDGWSMGVFCRELAALYAGTGGQLTALPVQYPDYAQWQRAELQGAALERQLAYWRTKLAGLTTLELPTDRPRPPVQSYRGAHQSLTLSAELSAALKQLSQRERVTLYMLLLAAFQVLLARYSGQEDIAVGSPIAGRTRSEFEGLIGFFVNTLVLRTDLSSNPRFRDLLGRVRESALDAYAHQDVPFEKLVEELKPVRDLSRSPLIQVMFALQNVPGRDLTLPGLNVAAQDLDTATAKFDLSLTLIEGPAGLHGDLEYATDLFDAQAIERMAGHFQMLLEGIVADPEQRIGHLPLLTEAERHQLLVEWNDMSADYPKDRCIHELFEAQVARNPEAVAVEGGGRRVSYRELNERAERLAERLRAEGVRSGSLVAIYVERSIEMVGALLGVWKAGGAYVPIDPGYPAERVRFMLEDTQALVVLTQRSLAGAVPAAGAAVLHVDAEEGRVAGDSRRRAQRFAMSPEQLAYVIYTSGSTGRPNGVPITHRSLFNLMCWHQQAYEVTPADRATQIAGPAFDASVWEIWPYLTAGASVHILDEATRLDPGRLVRWLIEQRITLTFLPTPLAEAALRESWPQTSALRVLLTGGDKLSQRPAHKLPFRLINHYGPTENTVVSTCAEVSAQGASHSAPPIGRPLPNTRAYVLDAQLQPVPIGVPGELLVGGVQLASGYWNRPELTAEKFVPDPFSGEVGARLYRTGDLARYLPGGNIEYLGRIDHQVKIRGFRIELGEIEAVLAEHAAVRQAVVIAREDAPGDKRLVAYIVPTDATGAAAEALRALLRERLPEYMRPSAYVVLERLPLTPNGKIDRRALLAPQCGRDELHTTFVPPRHSLEESITEVWREVLKLEQIGVHDSFFELGGHSLLAAQVVARLAKVLKVEVPLRRLFEAPTVAALALEVEKILGAHEALETLPIVRVARTGDLPLSFGQQRLWFLDRLEEKSTAYHMPMAMRLRGDLKRDALDRAINAIVARHESLRTHFVVVEGEPAQVVAQALKIALPVEDLSALEEGAREAAIAAALQREREAPFNLNQGPLLRITLLKLGEREHILLWVCHHIVSDGWSTSVFNRELATLYEAFCEGRDNPLEPLAVQYPDYALWQRRWLQGEALERLLAYWTNKLEGAPPLLALPTDRPRTTERSNRAESRTVELPEELADALSGMCQRARVTLFMALLAAFKVLLARYSGQEDIVIGTPIAVRNHVAIEGLIGFFLNTIALRTDLSGNPTFEELLKRVRTTALEAYAHQDLPFEKLIEKINPERNLSHTPVFQVLFNMHNFEEVPPSFAGLEVERLALPDPDAKFDLTLYAMEVGGRLKFRAVYSTDLFDGARIERMLDQWQHLLTQVAENPNRPIHNYSLLTAKTMRLLPNPAIALDEPFGVPVFRQFLAVAQVNAAQSAVRHEGRDWTYQQLEDTSKRIAKQLVACGVRSGEVVVVSGQRSFGLVASILGVLGARGIFLLIDPSLPSTRRDLMLQEARGAHWLHVGDGHDEDGNWSAAFRGLLTTRISSGGFCLDPYSEAAMEDVALVDAAPDEAAYIFFTSGTTGKPKAIVGSHKGLSHFIDWERQILGVVHNDRVAQLTGLSFDVVLRDIFLPLTTGATLCLPRPEIVSQGDQLVPWLRREGITILHAVPSLAHTWLDSLPPETHVPTLRWVLFAGEPLTGQLILQWRKRIGGAGGMINLYGPTETTLAKCFHVLPTNPGVGIQPIGRPLPFTQALVLSQGGQLCGIGEPGEIVIRTPFRTLGYLNGSDSDRARFAPNPFRDDPSDLVYRTGDIGAYDNQGQLLISGRLDDQIKIRGSRVEPAEVDATLAQHPNVQQCAVVAREDGSREKCLVAYVVQRPNCASAGVMGLRDFLKRSLPDYMIPAAFVVLDKLPLTPNGKLDCKALPAPGNIRPHLVPDYVGPRNTAEETLVDVWKELLKLDKIGVHDDFFELGGHSLIATRLASQIRRDFNIEIPLRAIFENPTIEGLARRILEQQATTMASDEMEELLRELESLPEESAESRDP